MPKIDLAAARDLLDFGTRLKSTPRAEEQLQGSVALHNLLAEHRCAYLADEVGMGKTYVALGAMALMRHFRPGLRVLVITPRENIQIKWMKELGNLVQNNLKFPDLRVKAVNGKPAMPLLKCERLLDLVHQANLHRQGCFFARMSSFSLGLADMSSGTDAPGRRGAAVLRDELRKHLPWLPNEALDLRERQDFKNNFARAVCCALPVFDLVIVDEAHNLKRGFGERVAARNRVIALCMGRKEEAGTPAFFKGYGTRARRVLFLSATPIEDCYSQLWNQLDIFGLGQPFKGLRDKELDDDQKKAVARSFLIRRVTSMPVGGEELTKNLYRREWRRGGVHEHDEPIRVTDKKQRLVLALVQKKVAEIIGHERFGNSFQMGMLASFESFQQTAASARCVDADGKAAGNFDDSDQTDDALEREGVDVRGVNRLARSYRRKFNQELPHPKMDSLVDCLGEVWRTGSKALVFVRRIASVTDLKRKLDERYDRYLFGRLQKELPPAVQGRLEELIEYYLKERTDTRDLHAHDTVIRPSELLGEPEDKGGKDTFFAWFFRGDGPPDVLSGAALLKRFRGKAGVYATFFEDNLVSALLQCEAENTVSALAAYLHISEAELLDELGERAARHLSSQAKKIARADSFDAVQTSAILWIAESPGPRQEDARVISHQRFSTLSESARPGSLLAPRSVAEHLNLPTFFTELRAPARASLRAAIWPASDADTFEERFREEFLRGELLASAARLGHGLIDLYILLIQQTGSMKSRARDGEDETPDPQGGGQAGAISPIQHYLDRLEQQMVTPLPQRDWAAFDELSQISANFHLILDVNLPTARDTVLAGMRKEIANKLLGHQQPVGGMWGSVNGRLVKQFRMPGYPFVMIATDLVQEGEDLHTFCSTIHHYGISWTPSGMEQRTGRIDRVRSQTERSLLAVNALPDESQKLQVHYPHLEDTVEVLQVRRLLTRMNHFLRLMHEGLQTAGKEERSVNVSREILRHHDPVPAINDRLHTAFPVDDKDLRGELTSLARTSAAAAGMEQRFASLRALAAEPDFVLEHPGPGDLDKCRIFGTVSLGARRQPFGLYLHSLEDYPLVRCISPVGRVAGFHALDEALAEHALPSMRLGAIKNARADQSYDLTAEDDVLLGDAAHDLARITHLVLRVVHQADELERRILGTDKPLATFKEDMENE